MNMRYVILTLLLCLNFMATAKPIGGTIILSSPGMTIDPQDWDDFAERLKPKLSKVFDLQPKKDMMNLIVEVHGAAAEPYYQLQIKEVSLFDLPDDHGVPGTGVLTYAIGGFYAQYPNGEYLCKVRVDLPINNPDEKYLVYTFNDALEPLNSAHAQNYEVMGYFTQTVFKNIQEVCYIGYWGYIYSRLFQSYEQVNRFLVEQLRQDILKEYPSLSNDTEALHKEIIRRFKEINNMPLSEDQLPQT